MQKITAFFIIFQFFYNYLSKLFNLNLNNKM